MDTRNLSQALADGPAIAGQIIDGACVARGFTAPQYNHAGALVPSNGNPGPAPCGTAGGPPCTGEPQPLPPTRFPGGGTCKPGPCGPGESCSFLPPGLLESHGYGGCGLYTRQIQDCFLRKCQQVCDPCWLQLLELSIARQSWAMVRNQIGRTFMRLGLSGYVASNQPVPDPDSSATTDFVANVPVAPGESVLVRQDRKFTIPWRPGCLKLTLGFSAGSMEDNMTHISAKVFVLRRGTFATSGNLKAFAVEWNPDEFYDGTQFRCGDNCAEVQITGTLGCAVPIEHVGDDNELVIQITNDAAATNSITAISTIISFAGLKKACCNDCISGKSCSCK